MDYPFDIRWAIPCFHIHSVVMGGFNLYDGIIQHKILQLHPVREGVVSLFWYDVTWNGMALGLLLGGWLWWRTLS